ncbi:MAG TPA: hypothetical protein VKX40_07250 [Aequorivita sp.]|nr:hypothetical protein [Aequorivita sp.]
MKRNKMFRSLFAIVLIAFASATLFMSSSVIFDWFGIREMEGDYVPFIVSTNFIAGWLYLVSAYGLLKAKKWAFWILIGTTLFLAIALVALALYINSGGAFELKNVGAMGFRIALTIAFSLLAYYSLKKY